MAVQITPTATQHEGMAASPIGTVTAWVVTFQLNSEQDFYTAISIPVEGPITHHEAKQQALKKLQTFLNEASKAAKNYHMPD